VLLGGQPYEKKRMCKAEKLEKIIEGRQKWEAKEHPGGSTNTLVSCLIIVERLQVHDYVLSVIVSVKKT